MSTTRNLITIMGLFTFLFGGCSKQPAPTPPTKAPAQPAPPLTAPPEVTSESEEGFHDLVFWLQDIKQLPDGSQSLHGLGTYQGRPLGLEVVLGPTWQAGSLGKDVPLVTYSGVVTYRSTGADSDAFIQALDGIYSTKLSPKVMRRETPFTAISLGGDPRDLKSGAVHMKLFFESDKQDEYAEFYTNIRLADHRLEVHEKDPEYRLPIIKALQPH